MTRKKSFLAALLRFHPTFFLCFLIVLAGCNSGPETGSVSGTVLFDGEPLRFGSVMFQNVAGGQPAVGEIRPDGTFVLSTFRPEDGAIIGKHRVRVVCYSSQEPKANGQAGPAGDALGKLLIPERYTSLGASGLSAEVTSEGLDNFLIELSSKRSSR